MSSIVPPRYGTAAAQARAQHEADHGPKPTANPDVPFRFSEAWGCPREIAYRVLDAIPSNPATVADHHVMWMGDQLHEDIQRALTEQYGESGMDLHLTDDGDFLPAGSHIGVAHEVKATTGDWSGHIDTVHDQPDGTRTVLEVKSKGDYQWKKATGTTITFNRGQWNLKQRDPDCPADAVAQAAMCARAVDADDARIVILAREPFSKNAANGVGLDDEARFCLEFHFTRDELERVATAVEHKGNRIKMHLLDDELPSGYDHETGKEIHPLQNPNWKCKSFCNYRDMCREAGPGVVPVPVELRSNR